VQVPNPPVFADPFRQTFVIIAKASCRHGNAFLHCRIDRGNALPKASDMSDVAKEIIAMIVDKTSPGQGEVKVTDRLDELGLDSLQVVELTFLVEEKFDVEIPFNANSDIEAKTVADLVRAVEGLIAAKAARA
jgi:acyl carrier protein